MYATAIKSIPIIVGIYKSRGIALICQSKGRTEKINVSEKNTIADTNIHNKKNGRERSEDIKTHIGVYKELKECSVDEIYVKNLDQNNYCVTELSKKQKDILRRLGADGVANVNGLLRKFRENISGNDD